jgi:hypothetical protein
MLCVKTITIIIIIIIKIKLKTLFDEITHLNNISIFHEALSKKQYKVYIFKQLKINKCYIHEVFNELKEKCYRKSDDL